MEERFVYGLNPQKLGAVSSHQYGEVWEMPMFQEKIAKNLFYQSGLLYTGKYLSLKPQDIWKTEWNILL